MDANTVPSLLVEREVVYLDIAFDEVSQRQELKREEGVF